MSTSNRLLPVVLVLLLPAAAPACLWDHDTLAMERARFPSALELITGKFLRHSPEFYEWRVRDRLAKLEKDSSNLALLDDLAVAYEKLGQHDKAIEIALKQDKLQPNRYETLANLGTFYLHAGQLEKGVAYIDRAIQINPDAHFGREKYQKLLVQYVMAQRKKLEGKTPLPLRRGGESFRRFVAENGNTFSLAENQAAVKGVLGMMKFGHHDSPALLEVLGDLLTYGGWSGPITPETIDAKQLAARAYLKAAYETKDSKAKEEYREYARLALQMQTTGPNGEDQMSLVVMEAAFKQELVEADAWYADLRAKELAWIRDGKNPEAEFDKLYAAEPTVSGPVGPDTALEDQARRDRNQKLTVVGVIAAVVAGAVLVPVLFAVTVVVIANRRRRSRPRFQPSLTLVDPPADGGSTGGRS